MAKILIIMSAADRWTFNDGTWHDTGYWAHEFYAPFEKFRDAGHDVVIATPGGVPPTVDKDSLAPQWNGGEEGAEKIVKALETIPGLRKPVKLEDVKPDDYDGVYVAGGHAPMEDLAVDEGSGKLLTRFLESGKMVGVMCHGLAALLPTAEDGPSPFAGYRMTGFSDQEEEQLGFAPKAPWLLETRLRELGATYEAAEPWVANVVVDRNLYTGQNPASAEPIAVEMLKALG
jgi:putative intracellular protease/amidase